MNSILRATLVATAVVAACGVASAQTSPASNQGEASTMVNGKPNAQRTPMVNDRAAVKADATAQAKATSSTPNNTTPKSGEASTTGPTGQPNIDPTATSSTKAGAMTSAERRDKRNMEVANGGSKPETMAKKNPADGTPK